MSPFVGLAGMGGRAAANFGISTVSGIKTNVGDPFGDGSAIAAFPLNSNANSLSGATFTGSLGGDTGISNFVSGGKFGNYWNGTGTTHLFSNDGNLAPSGAYSLSFWYRSNTTGQANKRLLTVKGSVVTAGWNNYNGSLGFYIGTGTSTSSVDRVAEIPDNQVNNNVWHHLVFTTTSAGGWKIYLDGTQYNNPVAGEGRSFNSGSVFAVTTYDQGDSYNTIGGIDQIRLFNRVITAQEVSDLYNETV